MDKEIPQNIIDIYNELDEGEIYLELYHSGKYFQYESFQNCLNYIYKYKNNFDEYIKWILPHANKKAKEIIQNMLNQIEKTK